MTSFQKTVNIYNLSTLLYNTILKRSFSVVRVPNDCPKYLYGKRKNALGQVRNKSKDSVGCYFHKPLASSKFTPVSHVIFTLDGVILESQRVYAESHRQFLEKYKKEFPQSLQERVRGRGDLEGAKEIIKELKLPMPPQQYVFGVWQLQRLMLRNLRLVEGVDKIICQLSEAHVPISLATASSAKSFKIKMKPHEELLKYFCNTLVAGNEKSITKMKPDPQIFKVAVKRFHNFPRDYSTVLVIENSSAGVAAAKAAGMQVILIADPGLSAEARKGADLVVSKYEEIKTEELGLPHIQYL